MLRCDPELCHNQPQTAFAFGKAEFPFLFHPVADIGKLQLLVDNGTFFQVLAEKANFSFFAAAQVYPIPIDSKIPPSTAFQQNKGTAAKLPFCNSPYFFRVNLFLSRYMLFPLTFSR